MSSKVKFSVPEGARTQYYNGKAYTVVGKSIEPRRFLCGCTLCIVRTRLYLGPDPSHDRGAMCSNLSRNGVPSNRPFPSESEYTGCGNCYSYHYRPVTRTGKVLYAR